MTVKKDTDYEDVWKEMKEFIENSSEFYSKDIQRSKEDLLFYSGDQFSSIMNIMNRSNRINRQFSELPKYVQAIRSSASKSPYHTELVRNSNLEAMGEESTTEDIQVEIDQIEQDNDFKAQMLQALDSDIVTGEGVLVLTTLQDEITGKAKPIVEAIRDISKVAFDRDATKDDKSDAEAAAIVNYISVKKAKREYGEDAVNLSHKEKAMPNQWIIPEDSVPLVTYYRKGFDENKGRIEYFRFCGKTCIQYEVLSIPMIPVFKMTGYIIYRDSKFTSVGIIDRIRDIQIGSNLAYSSLIERLNRSVKAGYICSAESIEGLEDQISKLSKGEVPLFLYKNGFEKPTAIVEAFMTDDLISVINSSTSLMSSVIGVPNAGVQGIKNINTTATEVLVQEANSESNVSCFYDSYERVSRNISLCFLHLLTNGQPGSITVKLVNGPSVITRNARRRQEISLMSTMMDDKTKPILAKYYADSLDDELGKKISGDIVANLDPSIKLIDVTQDPAAIHQLKQMQQLTDSVMQELEASKETIEGLRKENETLNLSLLDNREARQLDMSKAIMQNETDTNLKSAELALKDKQIANDFQIKQQNLRLDAQKEINDSIMENNKVIYGVAEADEAPEEMIPQE